MIFRKLGDKSIKNSDEQILDRYMRFFDYLDPYIHFPDRSFFFC